MFRQRKQWTGFAEQMREVAEMRSPEHVQEMQRQIAVQWVRMPGKVLDRQVLPGPRAPHPKLLTIELHPQDSPAFQAQVQLIPGDPYRWSEDLYYPKVGDITGFIVDTNTGEARFDMTDPRNCMSAHSAGGEAWIAMPDTDEEMRVDTGPPWLVAPACPFCSTLVDQRWMAAQQQPQCPSCFQPLPVHPVITSKLRRDALS